MTAPWAGSAVNAAVGSARDLVGAPRVLTIAPEMRAAVALALAHARARLALPAFDILWVTRLGGHDAQTNFRDGRVEICLNAAADLSPRLAAWLVLHEAQHAADGAQFCGAKPDAAEDRANGFAFNVCRQAEEEFLKLDWRPLSRRAREEMMP